LKIHHLAYLKIVPIPRLNEEQIERRLSYSYEMSNVDFRSVVFTDEKSFWLERKQRQKNEEP